MAHLPVSESDNIGPKPGPGCAGPAPGLDALSALSTCPLALPPPSSFPTRSWQRSQLTQTRVCLDQLVAYRLFDASVDYMRY